MAGTSRYYKEDKATGTSDYKNNKKSMGEQAAMFIAETPIAKLYLILLMIIYGIAVYSKGKNGIENDDVALLIFFSLFVVVSVISVEILTLLKRKLLEDLKNESSLLEVSIVFFKKYLNSIIFLIGLFTILIGLCYFSAKVIAKILWFLGGVI